MFLLVKFNREFERVRLRVRVKLQATRFVQLVELLGMQKPLFIIHYFTFLGIN